MKLSRARLVSPRRSAALASLALGLVAVCASSASGQTAEAAKPLTTTPITPYSLFQDAGIATSTNTLDVTRLPTFDSNGNIYYWNVSLAFDISSSGVPTLAAGSPAITASANPNSANFIPGTYVGAPDVDGGKDIIVVSGPSTLPGGGTAWTIAAGSSASSTPSTAVWYVEPYIADNPLASRIKSAGITNQQLSYGAAGVGGTWCENSLLGFSQVGNSLTISNYTNGFCNTYGTPSDQRTYILQQ